MERSEKREQLEEARLKLERERTEKQDAHMDHIFDHFLSQITKQS